MTTLHETDRTYLRTPTAADDELSARFRPTFDRIAEGNVARERERSLPAEQVRWLKDNPRVHKARIPGDWLVNGTDPVPDLSRFARGGQGD